MAALHADGRALAAALGREPAAPLRLHLVLEGAATRAPDLPAHPLLDVVRAPADGDATIAALAAELAGAGGAVLVVTADRGLRNRVAAAADTVGPGALLRALPGP